ncbi:MAG: glycine/sarcosine/betaine reductase selenoprotein B family protein [Pseudomonadales bacterium]|jgi:D-proline reductase (dithiol) PrdB
MRPPVDYIARTREQYAALGYPPYQWVENLEPPPFAALSKPLSRSRIGLVASGGIYVHGQIAFHYRDDLSVRRIPRQTSPSELRVTHFAYDLTDARRDPGVVFPLAALNTAAASGMIDTVSDHAYAFMGGIYSSRKVRERLAPVLADALKEDGVDAVLLVPV